jgi:hypothetical protein
MAEALWLQLAGVDYAASEDRRAISALSSPGVASGLVIAAGAGLSATVTVGVAIIDDGAGGAYVGYTTGTTTLTPLPASATTNVYIQVNTTTAEVTVVSGSVPSFPYLQLGSVVTSPTGVSTVTNTTTKATPPGVVGQFLPITGGTLTGQLAGPRFVVSGLFGVGGVDTVPNAPKGVRLGTSAAFARCHSRAWMTDGSVQNIATSTWTTVNMAVAAQNLSAYGAAPYNVTSNRFTCPVSGMYLVTGTVLFSDPGGANIGDRHAAITRRNSAGAVVWIQQGSIVSGTTVRFATVTSLMDANAGDTLELQAYQNQGATLQIQAGGYSGGNRTTCSFSLIMPF